MSIAVTTESHQNPYFSTDYRTARERFLESAKESPQFSFHDELKLDVEGPDGKDLFIDIVWLGPVDADKILVHLSATHGVEGHVGAAGQLSLIQDPVPLEKDTACVIVFGVNSFGYINNRRVNESNVDLNRNVREDRESPELYKNIDSFMNPKKLMTPLEFKKELDAAIKIHEWEPIKAALANGQYDYPEGMFYGGKALEQGPALILSWFENQFSNRANSENMRFLINDIHTGIGEVRGADTLLTATSYTVPQAIIDHFGEAMKTEKQEETMGGYKPLGLLVAGLAETIQTVTECTVPIFQMAQEFGTVPVNDVMMALWSENMHWHMTLRDGMTPNHESPSSLHLKKVFCLDDKESQDKAIARMREHHKKSIEYLQIADSLHSL